jgi:SAM-dependent methyltransferase
MINAFLEMNRRCSSWVERHLPGTRSTLHGVYVQYIADYLNQHPDAVIVECGAGRKCDYSPFLNRNSQPRIIGFDLSMEEMSHNGDLHERHVVDVCTRLPMDNPEADMINACRLVEHLPEPGKFYSECYRILKPGGTCTLFFPGRWAPFVAIKRILPFSVSKSIVRFFFNDESAGLCWSPLYYHFCTPSQIQKKLRQAGFEIEQIAVEYRQARCFKSIFPLYLCSVLYDGFIQLFALRLLAAYVFVVARKIPS